MDNELSRFQCRLPFGEEYCRMSDTGENSGNGLSDSLTSCHRFFRLRAIAFEPSAMIVTPFPSESTSKEMHRKGVETISGRLRQEREEGKGEGKTVLARVILKETSLTPSDIYNRLREEYPGAFVFYFETPDRGTWVGASPELLCRKRGNKIETVALAGTRPANTSGEWDTKNKEEQKIVKNYICSILHKFCKDVECSDTYTRNAGPVEHLCTDIQAFLLSEFSLPELLNELSPTPALSGYPKHIALKEIKDLEMWPRDYYGGYIMLEHDNGDADIYVNLRSMRYEAGKAALYVGGGIMADSTPDAEWEETERKASTLLKFL